MHFLTNIEMEVYYLSQIFAKFDIDPCWLNDYQFLANGALVWAKCSNIRKRRAWLSAEISTGIFIHLPIRCASSIR